MLIRRRFLELLGGLGAGLPAMRTLRMRRPIRRGRSASSAPQGRAGRATPRRGLWPQSSPTRSGSRSMSRTCRAPAATSPMAATARAAPDGYTVLCATSNIVTNISLYPKIPYDPYKDFEPVSLPRSSPYVLVVHPSVAAKSVNELVALAKADPQANSATRRPAAARPRISPASCSRSRSASTSRMCRSTAAGRARPRRSPAMCRCRYRLCRRRSPIFTPAIFARWR